MTPEPNPQAGEAGWPPHRDKGRQALAADGTPTSLTVWIPLTEATPENGCLYILPTHRDPVYGTDNENKFQGDLPQIRAVPSKPGDFSLLESGCSALGRRRESFRGTSAHHHGT